AVALLGALTQVYLQTSLEWVIKQTNNYYQLMFVFALIAAMKRMRQTPMTPKNNAKAETISAPTIQTMRPLCVTTI
ncbi:hypothetical protein, partial [Oleiphilus sp. HI0080]